MAGEVTKLKRSLLATFLNVGTSSSASYKMMGKGVTSQTIAYNPTVSSEQYVNEDSATASVDAYAPVINTPLTCYKGEPIFDYIDGLRQNRAIGQDCITDMLIVYLYDTVTGTPTKYKAEKQTVAISINEFGGDAGNSLALTFDLNFIGDPEKGTATISNGEATYTKNS